MASFSALALRWGCAASSWVRFLASRDQHDRGAVMGAYFWLHLKVALFAIINRPVRRLSLLGTEMRFANPHVFSQLIMEIFIEESYKVCGPPPATIVDLGSNIGMSILWYKRRWPECSILGVEASPEIFRFLSDNVRGLSAVTVVNRAVGDRAGQVMFYSASDSLMGSTNSMRGGSAGTMVEMTPASEFITGPTDLLKIDIEGSETLAFAELEASGKLALIRQMSIEYHHHLPGESRSLAEFLERLEHNGFQYEFSALIPPAYGSMQDILIRAWRSQSDQRQQSETNSEGKL